MQFSPRVMITGVKQARLHAHIGAHYHTKKILLKTVGVERNASRAGFMNCSITYSFFVHTLIDVVMLMLANGVYGWPQLT
jgi:hypothetical protein